MRALRLGRIATLVAPAALVALVALAACGDNVIGSPFQDLPLGSDLTEPSLAAPVHIARDRYGIAHVRATTIGDGGFAQGYVTAHDRLPQMDLLRRMGAGTLAELYGDADPSLIDSDLVMRAHRNVYYAQATWAALQASSAPRDAELVALLQRYSDGVNAYAADLQAGRWSIDPAVRASWEPAAFAAWSPIDSLVIARFHAFSESWSAPYEVRFTELYQKLRATFDAAPQSDAAAFARRGISRDLMTIAPVAAVSPLAGFPDAGSAVAPRLPEPPARPVVPQAVFDAARAFLAPDPHAFMRPWVGGNSWAVGPALASGGVALLATDQHAHLANPSLFYPTHLTVEAESQNAVDVEGVTIAGIPGVLLGTNGDVAWGAAESEHDVNDVYFEQLAPDAALETFTETIRVGTLGAISSTQTATYEVVPQHGVIIPTIANHAIAPRTSNSALSIRYTGDAATFELRALWNLAHAHDVHAGIAALAADITYGSESYTLIDNAAPPNIAWTSAAAVPVRAAAAYAWSPLVAQDAVAPFMVLPGDGTAEWTGLLDAPNLPRATNPATGSIVTANADPVGATFDDDALDQPIAEGEPAGSGVPLYAGVAYAPGLRQARITDLLAQATAAGPLTADDMARIQRDTQSTVGATLVPPILLALSRLDQPEPNPTDVAPYLASLSPADRQRLATARQTLTAWTFDTGSDSTATAIFNVWMHEFLLATLSDEFAAIDFDLSSLPDEQLVRIISTLLIAPHALVTSPATQQPILCDDMSSASDDSCSKQILLAMVKTMAFLETSGGEWGDLHTLTLASLLPGGSASARPALAIATGPYAGDNFGINRADTGWASSELPAANIAAAQRFIATAAQGEAISFSWALPGGAVFDSRDEHYRDLLDRYALPLQQFPAAFTLADINRLGETRWEMHP